MADKEAKIIISAEDRASNALNKVKKNGEDLAKSLGAIGGAFTIVGAVTARAVKSFLDSSVEMENSVIGLQTVSKAFKVNIDDATTAAQELSKDGLMSVKESAEGLKNLLATGFSLPEAIKLMKGLKDSAAFNRQGTLKFGDAIVGATQGLKNQNSIMVDNAGVTKNLSIILKEAGYSQQDLMNVTSDAGVRQALFNGILKETSIFQGDADRASESFGGQMAQLSTSVFLLKSALGDALKPTLGLVLEQIKPLATAIMNFAKNNPEIVAALTVFAGAIGAIGAVMLAVLPIILLYHAGLLPMTLIIGGIAIAIALVVAAIYYWRDELAAFVEIAKTKFDELMTRLQPVFNKFIEIKDYFVAVFKPLVVEAIEAIRLKFIEWYDKVIEIKNELVKLLDAFSLWFEETFGKSIQDTIKEKLIQSGDDWQSGWTGNIKTMIDVFGFLIEKIGETIRKIGELKNLLENSGPLGQAVLKTFGTAAGAVNPLLGLLSKQHGGIVPGGAGDAVPALLHGGERVVSRTGTDVNTGGSSSGTTVNLIIEGDVNSMDMVQNIVDAVKGALGRDSELAQLGVSI